MNIRFKIWAAISFICLGAAPLAAQITATTVPGTTTTTLPGTTTTTIATTYTPYSPDEFPVWANKLRRAEIIAVGAFPLAFLFSGIIYDVARYTNMYATGNPDTALYAPLFFAPSNKPAYTVDENLHLIFTSIGVAVGISLLDFIIGEIQEAAEREKKVNSSSVAPIWAPSPLPSSPSTP